MTLGIKADIIADLRQSRIRIFQEIGSSFYAEFQNIILNLFPCILTENPGKMPLADSNGFCNILQIDFMVIILGDIILALFCVAGKISRFSGICQAKEQNVPAICKIFGKIYFFCVQSGEEYYLSGPCGFFRGRVCL